MEEGGNAVIRFDSIALKFRNLHQDPRYKRMTKIIRNELPVMIGHALHSCLSEVEGNRVLLSIFDRLMGMSNEALLTNKDEFVDFGLKLSGLSAATCMPNYMRTVKYWRALLNALEDTEEKQLVRILYPGCGPFATLVLPILTLNLPFKIELVLLDVDSHSLQNCRHLWGESDNERLKIAFVEANVLEYDNKNGFDIVIFECLLQALQKEAQVAITMHVSQLLTPLGRLIPQRIECFLVATSMAKEVANIASLPDKQDSAISAMILPFRANQVPIFCLDKETNSRSVINHNQIELGLFQIPTSEIGNDLVITTIMTIDEENILYEYQCGLTFPFRVNWELGDDKTVNLGYVLRPLPEFTVQKTKFAGND